MCEAIWHRKFLLLAFSLSCIKGLRFTRLTRARKFKVLMGTRHAQSLFGLWGGLALLGKINQCGIRAEMFSSAKNENFVIIYSPLFHSPVVLWKDGNLLVPHDSIQISIGLHWLSVYGQKILGHFSKYLLLWSSKESHACFEQHESWWTDPFKHPHCLLKVLKLATIVGIQ